MQRVVVKGAAPLIPLDVDQGEGPKVRPGESPQGKSLGEGPVGVPRKADMPLGYDFMETH